MNPLDPFAKYRAKPGQKTQPLSFVELHSTKEFRDAYYQWVTQCDNNALNSENLSEELLELCVLYKFAKETNERCKAWDKELPDRTQASKRPGVIAAATNNAKNLAEVLSDSQKSMELGRMLEDLYNNPNDYIAKKMTRLPANRNDINVIINSLSIEKEEKEALYKLL